MLAGVLNYPILKRFYCPQMQFNWKGQVMMLKKLTKVTPKIVSQGLIPKAMIGVLSLSLIHCAQPERQAKDSKSRGTNPPANTQETPQDTPTNLNGGSATQNNTTPSADLVAHNEREKTSSTYLNIDQAAEAIKNNKDSILKIEVISRSESNSGENYKTQNGFIIAEKQIATSLNGMMPAILGKLGDIDALKNLSVEEIKAKVKDQQITETEIRIKNSSDESINTGLRLKVSDGTAFRIAKSIKDGKTLDLDSEGAVLVSETDTLRGKVIDKNESAEMCLRSATASSQNATPVLGRNGGGQRAPQRPQAGNQQGQQNQGQEQTQSQPPAQASIPQRQITIAGYQDIGAASEIKVSQGNLVDLQSALRSVGIQDSSLNNNNLACTLIAASVETSSLSLGSPIFENGKAVGMVVRQAGQGDKKRTFGISFKQIN
jgi:DNA-dependent RNA polymerase auxiliary subunit epsilon